MDKEKRVKNKNKMKLSTTIFIVTISLIIGILIRLYVFEIVKVDGLSMYPTFNNRQYLAILKCFPSVKRADIVIFKSHDQRDSIYVKRVIGLPNEHLQIKNNSILINDKELEEDYLPDYINTIGDIDMIIPEGEYFMLGDNRGQSKDSRIIGTIKEEDILGKVELNFF